MTCPQHPEDGRHRWGWRRSAGKMRWACVCGAHAPEALVPALEEAAAEAERVRSLRWGMEHEVGQPALPL